MDVNVETNIDDSKWMELYESTVNAHFCVCKYLIVYSVNLKVLQEEKLLL